MVQIREVNLAGVKLKLEGLVTDLNKIIYLESAIKKDFDIETKRFMWTKMAELYEERMMHDKAARAMTNLAGLGTTFREKIDNYLKAAELYAKAGRIDEAEDMFVKASRDSNEQQKNMINLTRKNIYLASARDMERKNRRSGAMKFYEKLIKLKLDDLEKREIKEKLVLIYKALGKFREADIVSKM